MKKLLRATSLCLVLSFLFVGCTEKTEQLTQAQIDEVNQAFEPLLPTGHETYEFIINPICHFISSSYDKPEDMNFEEFTRYFSTENMLPFEKISTDEFALLKQLDDFPFKEVATLEDMPVPIQRKPESEINAVLQKYMGITVESMDTGDVPYLGEPYHAFYTYTSDAGFGQFTCIGGEIKGDTVTLYSDTTVLTFQKTDGEYFIVSHKEK